MVQHYLSTSWRGPPCSFGYGRDLGWSETRDGTTISSRSPLSSTGSLWWGLWDVRCGRIYFTSSETDCIIAINTGLGEHILYVGSGRLLQMLKYLYIGIAGYYMCAGLVKLSLLVQYLRIFKTGALRTTCLALIYITGAWTLFWTIQGWFPCWPVSGMWNRLQTPKPKCAYQPRLIAILY
jgi:hypothetical protein